MTYSTGLDEDTVSIKCVHPVERRTLAVAISSPNEIYSCGTVFSPSTCGRNATGTVTVSPADLDGRTTCSLGPRFDYLSPAVGTACSFIYPPGTEVTATVSRAAPA